MPKLTTGSPTQPQNRKRYLRGSVRAGAAVVVHHGSGGSCSVGKRSGRTVTQVSTGGGAANLGLVHDPR